METTIYGSGSKSLGGRLGFGEYISIYIYMYRGYVGDMLR